MRAAATAPSAATATPAEAGRALVDPDASGDDARLHEALGVLRREAPVHRVDEPGFAPFWAVTRHALVWEAESRSEVFRTAHPPLLRPDGPAQPSPGLRTLLNMDGAEHRAFRDVTADWFRPTNLKRLQARLAELARDHVDAMAARGGTCDFVADVAVHFTLQVILSMLGLPPADYPRMRTLTQELLGNDDPELQREGSDGDVRAVVADFFAYFSDLAADRRARPAEDLSSVLVDATLDGRPLDDADLASYFVLLVAAGHHTTTSAIAGGLLALVEHPEELARLRSDPVLLPPAVDEMLRWVTPVRHFLRTATRDHDLGGTRITAGERVLLSYPSANRDDEVLEDPFRFDVGRVPNRHLAFGLGPHHCLGAQLARMEMRALFAELVPRLTSVELAGEPRYARALFVGGLKSLPISYALAAAA